jgi:hypothetical protein
MCRALLTLDNASQHLHHFCSLLSSSVYVDSRPQFMFKEVAGIGISAEITLPLSVDPSVRTSRSLQSWKTERMAAKDACFEAYKALHLAGLVNDNLLPSRQEEDDEIAASQIKDNAPSTVEISPVLDPWIGIAQYQQQNRNMYHRTLLRFIGPSNERLSMVLLTPVEIPETPVITLFWDKTRRTSVESISLADATVSDDEISTMAQITRKLMLSGFQGRMQRERYDFMWLLTPTDETAPIWSHSRLVEWLESTKGSQAATELIRRGCDDLSQWGNISMAGDARLYTPKGLIPGAEPILQCTRVPKRRDFLHPIPDETVGLEAYSKLFELPASECMVENLPFLYNSFAIVFPSVLHRFSVHMVAEQLRLTLLQRVQFSRKNLPILVQALTSSAVGEDVNYQR